MQRAQRGVDNHAVDLAIKVANLGLPLVVYFAAISNFLGKFKHYVFLNQSSGYRWILPLAISLL
jgi:deoxyribodipyrimidine photo-lyase